MQIVDYINSLYSQSQGGNAGTRAGWKGNNILDKETYTKTKLDTDLLSAIKEGKYRLLIITGMRLSILTTLIMEPVFS